jgi:hypothetical protein
MYDAVGGSAWRGFEPQRHREHREDRRKREERRDGDRGTRITLPS